MKAARLVLPISVLVIIASCAAPPRPLSWQLAGATDDDAITALSECRYTIGLNQVPAQQREQMTTDCMQAKGYRWR